MEKEKEKKKKKKNKVVQDLTAEHTQGFDLLF